MTESTKIIANGLVVTCDRHHRVGQLSVVIRHDRIQELSGDLPTLQARYPDAEVIDAAGKIVLPGFIDAWFHGISFLLQVWTAAAPMARWMRHPSIRKLLSYVHREATREELLLMYRAAYFAALKSGYSFVVEAGFDNLEAPYVAARDALKRTDLKGMIVLRNGDQIEGARRSAASNIRCALALPPEEELTIYGLQSTLRMAQEYDWMVAAPLAEQRKGHETLKRNFHRSALQILREFGLLDHRLLVAGMNHFEGSDIPSLATAAIVPVICPRSILVKGLEIPPLADFTANEIPLALGTDWGTPDPFATMRAMRLLLRVTAGVPVSAHALLAMQTLRAARALGVDHEIGSIEVGKKADLTFVDVSDVRIQHLVRPDYVEHSLSALLDELSSNHVTDVMINGEFYLRRGEIMTYAEEDLKRETGTVLERLMSVGGPSKQGATREDGRKWGGTILPLVPVQEEEAGRRLEETAEQDDAGRSDAVREGGREGKEAATPPPAPTAPQQPVGLPKTVKRVFGEDDVF